MVRRHFCISLNPGEQEAQLPQRNSASAAHVYLGWLTDRTMHRTPQNRRGCTISVMQTLWFKKCMAENAFCHEIPTEGHSRSFILQSFAGRQGVAYRHILLLAVSVKFSKTSPPTCFFMYPLSSLHIFVSVVFFTFVFIVYLMYRNNRDSNQCRRWYHHHRHRDHRRYCCTYVLQVRSVIPCVDLIGELIVS